MTDPSKEENVISNKEFVKSKECYSEVLQILSSYVPDSKFPTYDEWMDWTENDKLHTDDLNLAFRKPASGAGAAALGFAAKIGKEAFESSGFANLNADDILQNMRTRAEQALRQRARQTASKVFTSMGDTGDGGTSKANYSGGSRFNPTGLSQTLKPIDTSFNTDVKFIGQTRYYQDGVENTGPLILKQGLPGFVSPSADTTRDDFVWNLIVGPVTTEWNRKVSERVTWTGRVESLLTETNINSYINKSLQCCAVYYFWMSVIAFTDDPRNRNAAMDTLRDKLTPDDYNRLNNLRRQLMQTAIPPFVHKYMFYMMGTYRQNHLPSSPLMKIMPFGFASTSLDYFNGETALYDGLSPVQQCEVHLDSMKEFTNVLSRAVGDWGGIEPYYYTSSPRCDMDFTTFFTNASYITNYSPGGVRTEVILPTIANAQSEVVYNSHTDAPDGWVSAHVAPLSAVDGYWGTGLFHPWMLNAAGTSHASASSTFDTTERTTCVIWNADSTAGFYPIEAAQKYQQLAGNTYSVAHNSGVYHAFQKFGTERIILTPINALRQSNLQFVDLLYTDDISNMSSMSSSSSRSNSKMSGSYKGKGRRKSSKSKSDKAEE